MNRHTHEIQTAILWSWLTRQSLSPWCCKPSFKIIGLPVLEKKIFEGFYHIWTWRPSWSCDLDHLYKLSLPLPKEAPHEIWLWLAKRVLDRKIFENGLHIHVYSPGAGADNPLVSTFFSLTQLFSQLSPLLQVFPIKWLCNTFPFSNVYVTKFDRAVK